MTRPTGRHLGELAAALVDGELGHDARDRALAHLAHCQTCRTDVDTQRRLKHRLAGLPEPTPPEQLTDRLRELAARAGAPARLVVPTAGRTRSVRRPPGRPAGTATRPDRVPGGRRWRVAAAAAVAVLALGVGAFAVGGGPTGRPVVPQVTRFVEEHAATTTDPVGDPGGGAVTVMFSNVSGP